MAYETRRGSQIARKNQEHRLPRQERNPNLASISYVPWSKQRSLAEVHFLLVVITASF